MHRGLFVAPFGELADPRLLADLGAMAEESGWDGLFLWDHMWRPEGRPVEVSDAWTCLAAIAGATSRLRIGPMVTPLARRRPQKVARESVAIDQLSQGRLTVGVGLGVDTGGELARFAEEVDDRIRGDMLDEALSLLTALWSGEEVSFRGAFFTAAGVRFVPRPVQVPRIPIWVAARGRGSTRPIRRAARFEGLFPVGATPDEVLEMVAAIAQRRGSLDGFDVAMIDDQNADVASLERGGVTWLLRSIPEGAAATRASELIARGPR